LRFSFMLKRVVATLCLPTSHLFRKLPWVSSLFVLAVLTAICGCSNAGSSSGTISTFAGNAKIGYSGDGGAAVSAELWAPSGVAVDASGDLYIADIAGNVVRKVTASTGIITTVAGDSTYMGADTHGGYSGDGGPAVSAELNGPVGVALDASGNLYIADDGNDVIRKVAAATGIITTVAGLPGGSGFSGDGGPAVKAHLNHPFGIAADASGNLYIADTQNNVIREVSASTGIITTAAGNGYGAGTNPGGFSGDNGPATSAELSYPEGVALDISGNLYIADTLNMRVREVDASNGIITTVAGNGVQGSSGDNGAATSAELNHMMGISADALGNLYIADTGNMRIRKVDVSTGKISAMAGSGTQGYAGDGGPAKDAKLNNPWSTVVDASGNLYIADYTNSVVRKVTPVP
jgi:trimeric autotransporter adhesin